MSSKIIYYYQTFSGLTMDKLQGITHIHLASVHFGKNSAEGEYIHLNELWESGKIPWLNYE